MEEEDQDVIGFLKVIENKRQVTTKNGQAQLRHIYIQGERYMLMATLSDGMTSAKLVLFDKEAEKVVGKPITKLLDVYEKEDGKGRVYNILQECIGKQYKFKVKIGMSKYGHERELKGQKTLTNEEYEETGKANHEKEKTVETNAHSGEMLSIATQDPKEKRKHAVKPEIPKQENSIASCTTNVKRRKASETTT
ncbi:hypothetical protein KSS87_019774 [Heliosperma pusillum]|nr:hypothetical protein KSS87_019774 [Heliosperma pusillum]